MEGPRERSVDGEEAVYAGFALLLTERRAVVSSRGASVRLWGRVDTRGKIGRRYGNLGFRFRKVGRDALGSAEETRSRLCGMGFPIDSLTYNLGAMKKLMKIKIRSELGMMSE